MAPDAKKHARDTMDVPWNRYAPEKVHATKTVNAYAITATPATIANTSVQATIQTPKTLEESNSCSSRGACSIININLDDFEEANIDDDNQKRKEFLLQKNQINRALFIKALDSFYSACEREMDYSKVSDYQIKRGIIDGVCQTPRSIQNVEMVKIPQSQSYHDR